MIRATVAFLDDRLGAAPFLRNALRKAFPDHWSFMLGEVAAYCFLFLVGSGTYLALFFQPSGAQTVYGGNAVPSLDGRAMSQAYASVLQISFGSGVGLVIRQAHHWAALVFAAAAIVHLGRVFFTGAFRRPRDINWPIGVTMLILVLLNGFTGYSLPGDALSGAGLRIAQAIALAIPVVGGWAAYLFFGVFPGPEVISRLYTIHIFIVPLLLFALIGLHVAIVWRQKHTQFPGPGRSESTVVGEPLWPRYAVKTAALLFATFGVLLALGGLVEINPVWQYGPYDPWTAASPSQPDFYVGWLEGALRIAPPLALHLFGHTISAVFWPALALPALLFGVLYAWPWIERAVSGDAATHELLQFPWQNPGRTAFGAMAFAFVGLLLLAGSDDVQARLFDVPIQNLVWLYRVAACTLPWVAGFVAWRVCRELQARHAYPGDHPARVLLARNRDGGYEEERVIPTP